MSGFVYKERMSRQTTAYHKVVDDEEVRLQRLDVLGNLRIELHHLVEDALEEGAGVVLAL